MLLYHSYSSYETRDSTLYLHDASSGEGLTLSDGGFVHAMNGDFGSHPYDIVFMAITLETDAWDLYRYNRISGTYTNLTEYSGFRNEDPKFSPDGKSIVFKRGWWNHETDDFTYELAELDLTTGDVTLLTDTPAEESMPYYSADGALIYYAVSGSEADGIYRLDRGTLRSEAVYTASGEYAYYPVVSGDALYFTKWHSPDSGFDCIVEFANGNASLLPFNADNTNTSDACPVPGGMIYSSTANGSYDLWYWDGADAVELSACSTSGQELGAAYYSAQEQESLVHRTTDYLLGRSSPAVNMDADGDGAVNAFDLAFFKMRNGK